MTPAQRYDLIVNEMVLTAICLQKHRTTFSQTEFLKGQDHMAIAEYHTDILKKECHNLNLAGDNEEV